MKSWHNECIRYDSSFSSHLKQTTVSVKKKLRILLLIFFQNCICSKSEKRIFWVKSAKKIVRTQFEMLAVKFGVLNDGFCIEGVQINVSTKTRQFSFHPTSFQFPLQSIRLIRIIITYQIIRSVWLMKRELTICLKHSHRQRKVKPIAISIDNALDWISLRSKVMWKKRQGKSENTQESRSIRFDWSATHMKIWLRQIFNNISNISIKWWMNSNAHACQGILNPFLFDFGFYFLDTLISLNGCVCVSLNRFRASVLSS